MYEKYVELRDAKGITDSEVAKELQITLSTFYDWKSGRSKPKLEKLAKIARYFGVNIEFFLSDKT